MKTSLLTFGLFLLCIPFLSANSISVDSFTEIRVWGNLKIILIESEEERVNVERHLNDVDISVENGVLKVKRDKPLNPDSYDSPAIEVVIEYRKFDGLRAAAGARVKNVQKIIGDHLWLEFTSGAQGKLVIEVNDLDLKTTAGAQLKLSGKTYSQHTKVTSGGVLRANNLLCSRTYIKSTTGGHAKIVATETMEARATTGGMIDYEGDPDRIEISDNLGGDVRRW